MKNPIWFDKYRIIKILGRGGSAEVFLAEHIKLKSYRAIKKISKENPLWEQLLKESQILKNLKHSCIPVVYDVEEDAHNSYIIEEYIEGASLKDFIRQRGQLSEKTILSIAIQLCDVLQYLYSNKNPILYLDLKPDNIIISQNIVKLIDFGASSFQNNLEERRYSFGTKGFAAPELLTGIKPDERTDIYGVGALLYYMITGSTYGSLTEKDNNKAIAKSCTKPLNHIIRHCLRHNSLFRYPTITVLKNKLLELNRKNTISKPTLSIAIAGTQHRIGTTHLAILIASYLNANGNKSLYIEKNPSGHLSMLLARYQKIKTTNGIYHLYSCNLISASSIEFTNFKEVYPITVTDYGLIDQDNQEEFLKADIRLVIAGAKEWEFEKTEEVLRLLRDEKDVIYLFNFLSGKQHSNITRFMGKITNYRIPYEPNPFLSTKNKYLSEFMAKLIQN